LVVTRPRVAVIGAGIAGLVVANRLLRGGRASGNEAQVGPAPDVVVLERSDRAGGKIRTERFGGHVVEAAADSFLSARPGGVSLCTELGLVGELENTQPFRHRGFIRRGSRMLPLPEGLSGLIPAELGALLRSGVLSAAGRARFALDLVLPPGPPEADESVASFARRRFGNEAYDWLIEPLLAGIHGGDGEQLSLRATFPALHLAEQQSGSVLAGLRKAAMTFSRSLAASVAPHDGARTAPQPDAARTMDIVSPGFTPFVAPRAGMERLIEALLSFIREASAKPESVLALNAEASTVRREAECWVLCAGGTGHRCDAVVLAVPAFEAARIVSGVSVALGERLAMIPFEPATVVYLAYARRDVPRRLDGHGYLNPRATGRAVAACTWTTSKFAHRAPPETVLLRLFLRGARWADEREAPEAEAVRAATTELEEALGIRAAPLFYRVFRWPRAMPQYTIGHLDRLHAIDGALAELPGLFLAGNSYRGVGIPDTIVQAESVARDVGAYLAANRRSG
jgi:oxygen-dependent protoporphyrinogen oxidase